MDEQTDRIVMAKTCRKQYLLLDVKVLKSYYL